MWWFSCYLNFCGRNICANKITFLRKSVQWIESNYKVSYIDKGSEWSDLRYFVLLYESIDASQEWRSVLSLRDVTWSESSLKVNKVTLYSEMQSMFLNAFCLVPNCQEIEFSKLHVPISLHRHCRLTWDNRMHIHYLLF